jgi:F-type H+-transporting ATPase subunit b
MLLDPHVGTIIWTLVTFAVVLVVLRATVWRPLLGALDEREKRISDALEEAERARKEALTLVEEHQQKLLGADTEAREIVRLAREAGERVEQEIVSKAREEAQRTTEQARRAIESEKQAAIAELRRETADLAVKAAGALIEANLDDERNRKLVEDLIAGIPSGN